MIDVFSHVAQGLLDVILFLLILRYASEVVNRAILFMPSASNSFYKGFRSVETSRLGTL